jgi:hypothetical protein
LRSHNIMICVAVAKKWPMSVSARGYFGTRVSYGKCQG